MRAGINIRRHYLVIYALSSFFATLAGIIYMLEYITGKADAGSSFLLDAIVGGGHRRRQPLRRGGHGVGNASSAASSSRSWRRACG